MAGSLVFILTVAALGGVTVLIFRRQAAIRSATAWIRRKLGGDVLLMSDSVILSGRRRVRGVIAMTSEVVAWRAIRYSARLSGEMPLSETGLVMWCDAVRGAHPAIMWRIPGRLLTLRSVTGDECNLLLDERQAILWEKVLDMRMSETPETQMSESAEQTTAEQTVD